MLSACWGRPGQLMPKLHLFCPFHVKAIRRKKGRRNANRGGGREGWFRLKAFLFFSGAVCVVKLCQENVDEEGRCQRQALFFFLFFCTSSSIFLSVLYDSLPYLFVFSKLSLSTLDDFSQNRNQYSIEVYLQQGNQ